MWELDYKESREPKNQCFWTVVLEKTLESPLDSKEIQTGHPKGDQSGIFIGKTDAEAETPIFGHLMQRADSFERPWCWERLKAVGEGDDRGWDDWMASPTEWTWVGVNSGYYWWTGKPGVLQSMGSQGLYRLSNWTELKATVLNHFSHVWLCDPMKLAYQASLSMGISRQKYWSGLLCPPPGVLPDPAIEPTSPATPAL